MKLRNTIIALYCIIVYYGYIFIPISLAQFSLKIIIQYYYINTKNVLARLKLSGEIIILLSIIVYSDADNNMREMKCERAIIKISNMNSPSNHTRINRFSTLERC